MQVGCQAITTILFGKTKLTSARSLNLLDSCPVVLEPRSPHKFRGCELIPALQDPPPETFVPGTCAPIIARPARQQLQDIFTKGRAAICEYLILYLLFAAHGLNGLETSPHIFSNVVQPSNKEQCSTSGTDLAEKNHKWRAKIKQTWTHRHVFLEKRNFRQHLWLRCRSHASHRIKSCSYTQIWK